MTLLRTLAIASTLGAAVAFVPSSNSVGLHRYRRTVPSAAHVSFPTVSRTSSKLGLAEIDDSNYLDYLGGEKAVLIDACAPWCGPCKLIQQPLERSADKWSKSVHIVKYNVEGEKSVELQSKLRDIGIEISGLPSLILFKDGQPISSRTGVVTDMDINVFLSSNLHQARVAREEAAEVVLEAATR